MPLRAAVDLKAANSPLPLIAAFCGRRRHSYQHRLPAPVALADALNKLVAAGKLKTNPMKGMVAAVSVGIVMAKRFAIWNICRGFSGGNRYERGDDRRWSHHWVQGTAEGGEAPTKSYSPLLALARGVSNPLIATQKSGVRKLILRAADEPPAFTFLSFMRSFSAATRDQLYSVIDVSVPPDDA